MNIQVMGRLMTLSLALLCPMAALVHAAAPVSAVEVALVQQRDLSTRLPLSGSVYSRNDIELAATLGGELEWVAEPGSVVQQGAAVARLRATPLKLRRDEARLLMEREQINSRRLSLELERLHRLREQQSISLSLLDDAQAERDASTKQAEVLASRLQQIEEDIGRSTIRARFAGVVVARNKQSGEYITAGEAIARLVDVEHLEVRIAVPITQRRRLLTGVQLQITSGNGAGFEAPVRTLLPAGDPQSQTFEARIDVPREQVSALVAGQLLSVHLPVSSGIDTLAVPRDAIVMRSDGNFVFRVNSQSQAERIAVNVGPGEGNVVSVEGNLHAGERVVIRGAERLQHGQAVSVLEKEMMRLSRL